MSNVLVIGDLHIPFTHPKYLAFCKQIQKEYNCKTVVQIGDAVDNHAINYHEHDPDGYSSGEEVQKTLHEIQRWYKAFPNVLITMGSHDLLPYRKALTHGLSKEYIKNMSDLWKTPAGWVWDTKFIIDDVIYTHGTGMGGRYAHINRAKENMQSTVIGHLHTSAGVGYIASHNKLIFGMNVGCGIDIPAYAFAYQKDLAVRPIIGCGVVLNSGRMAQFIPMRMD